MRGGEKVLEVLCERYPDAELFTLVHVRGRCRRPSSGAASTRRCIQYLPGVGATTATACRSFRSPIEQFDLDRFDLVVSISHCCAKSIVAGRARCHLCYCLTPMRYAWDQFDAYFGPDGSGRSAARSCGPVMARLARWDRDTAGRVDRYVDYLSLCCGQDPPIL